MNAAMLLAWIDLPLANVLFDSIRSRLNSTPSTSHIVLFAAGVLALVVIILIAARHMDRKTTPPRPDLLKIAIDVLRLSESERRDVLALSTRGALAEPAAALLSPRNLATAMQASDLDPHADHALILRLERLSERLFGEPLPEITATRAAKRISVQKHVRNRRS